MQALPRAFSLGILLTIGHASVISADPILVTDSRLASAYVQIGGEFPAPDLQRPSAPFAPFVVVGIGLCRRGSRQRRDNHDSTQLARFETVQRVWHGR